jgi:hypothetical protein
MGAHYGASYLFYALSADRFGTDPITAIVQSPANGIDGIDAVLRRSGQQLRGDLWRLGGGQRYRRHQRGRRPLRYQTADINPARIAASTSIPPTIPPASTSMARIMSC